MRKLLLPLLALIALIAFTLPAQAAKAPSTTNQAWTTQITSASDGSLWVLVQADKISQPGNAYWYISWVKADGSPCYVGIGQKGTQTGATWGPTSYTFAYYTDNVTKEEFSLQLGEAYPSVVDVTPYAFVADCAYGVLKTSSKNVVLDPYVPLPWSQ